MSEPSTEIAGPTVDKVITKFTTGAWRLLMLGLQVITIGFGALLVWQGKNMLNQAIAKSPDVTTLTARAAESDAKITAVQEIAKAAQAKADQNAVTQGRVFDALKQDHEDNQGIKILMATLTERIDDVKSGLARVEAKQDQPAAR